MMVEGYPISLNVFVMCTSDLEGLMLSITNLENDVLFLNMSS